MLNIDTTVSLCDGRTIPLLGFGVFQIKDRDQCLTAVKTALDVGYRHIDTAAAYNNEQFVGQAIRESDVPREEVYITTKLWIDDFSTTAAPKALDESLGKLGMDYVDLYLLHWPIAETGPMMDAWAELQKARDAGKIRSIGVSNFTVQRFEKDFRPNTDETPAVNQVEFHPFWYRKALLDYCRDKNIRLEAYSPLVRAQEMDNATLRSLADKYGKTPAQILIRWQLQHEVVVIPKSSHPERIAENADVYDFEIAESDMGDLDDLNRNESIINWRPHPNFY